MSDGGLFPFDNEAFDAASLRSAQEMGEQLARTVVIARMLVGYGRTVDMSGLDRGVGLFVAKALDLPPELGRQLRPNVATLLLEVDALTEALRVQAHA